MAQWFTDNASITNLIVTHSYIGSGSTSFNKSESILYINNGLRQGINNGDFYTVTGTSNHIQGFNNGGTNVSHVEGYDNNKTNSTTWAHVEGKNNTMNGASSHIEGEYNYQLSSQVGTSWMGNHTDRS